MGDEKKGLAKKGAPSKAPAKKEPEPPKAEPKKEEPAPAPAEEPKKSKNVLAMFSQSQIQEFKEAFTMIDQNRDGFIDVDDLKDMYNSLGREASDKECKELLKEAPDPDKLNFTGFLTLFGEKTSGTDPEATLLNAFKMFDEQDKGVLDEAYVKDLLMNMGDNFKEDEIRQTWKEIPVSGGKVDYPTFVRYIKRGKDDE